MGSTRLGITLVINAGAFSDWERILSDTKAVSYAKEAVEEVRAGLFQNLTFGNQEQRLKHKPYLLSKSPLFKNDSFTVEHVLKDRR